MLSTSLELSRAVDDPVASCPLRVKLATATNMSTDREGNARNSSRGDSSSSYYALIAFRNGSSNSGVKESLTLTVDPMVGLIRVVREPTSYAYLSLATFRIEDMVKIVHGRGGIRGLIIERSRFGQAVHKVFACFCSNERAVDLARVLLELKPSLEVVVLPDHDMYALFWLGFNVDTSGSAGNSTVSDHTVKKLGKLLNDEKESPIHVTSLAGSSTVLELKEHMATFLTDISSIESKITRMRSPLVKAQQRKKKLLQLWNYAQMAAEEVEGPDDRQSTSILWRVWGTIKTANVQVSKEIEDLEKEHQEEQNVMARVQEMKKYMENMQNRL